MVSNSNTSEELKKIRENEIIDLLSTINGAKKKLERKLTEQQRRYLEKVVQQSKVRIWELEVKLGKRKLPVRNTPSLSLNLHQEHTKRKPRKR